MSQHARKRPEQEKSQTVGESVPRVDASAKVTGQALYVMDLEPGNLLHAHLVKSQVPHAGLTNVDTSVAEASPGVVAVATAADVPNTKRGAFIFDQPILARNKVRYIGEPIAVVAAETPELAENAAQKVEVEYEQLDTVFDLEKAFSRNPPGVVHKNIRDYDFATRGDPRYGRRGHVSDEDADRPNLMYKDAEEIGDVNAAFETATHVIKGEYETKPIQHCAMESRVAIAHVRHDGLQIWTSHQVPHNVKKKLCSTYPNLSPADVTVKTPYVGGGFGGKITAYLEVLVVAIAQLVSRPVRLQLSRSEEFTTGISRPQVITRIQDGVTADGDLVAREVEILFNSGAYNEQVFRCTVSATDQVYGAYDIPNVRWNSYAVYTNRPKYGAFRGFGKPEVNWAIERHMDRTAHELGLDPLEYRTRNLLCEGDVNVKGEVLGPNNTEQCLCEPVGRLCDLDLAAAFPDYASDDWHLGVGFAYANKSVARAAGTVTIKVRRDMEVEVYVGASDIGQGSDTAFAQMAAEEFGVDIDKVAIISGETDRTPYTRGPTGSRYTYHTGKAIRNAVEAVKARLTAVAAAEFEAEVDTADLEADGEFVYVTTNPDRRVHVNDLFSDYDHEQGVSHTVLAAGGELIGTATYDARDGPGKHAAWTPIGVAAVVAVNELTGEVEVVQLCTACDVGRAVNPKNVEQQLEGATAQGIATAIYEEIVYDGGRVVNPNFKDYRIPGPTELPYRSETIILESYDDEGPYGAKGVGEAGMLPAAPAIGNAVTDATGIDFEILPLSPERILDAINREWTS